MKGGRGGAELIPVLPHQSSGIMVKAQDVTRYKASGQKYSRRTVLIVFPASVRWQLSRIQIGTTFCPELGKHDTDQLRRGSWGTGRERNSEQGLRSQG